MRPRQIHAWLQELNEFQRDIENERAVLYTMAGGQARARTRDVNQRILNNEGAQGEPLVFGQASQNLTMAMLLLRGYSEPATLEARRIHEQLQTLLEHAVVQQAKSSASHQHEQDYP